MIKKTTLVKVKLNMEKCFSISRKIHTFVKRIPLTENEFQKGEYCLIFKTRNNMK